MDLKISQITRIGIILWLFINISKILLNPGHEGLAVLVIILTISYVIPFILSMWALESKNKYIASLGALSSIVLGMLALYYWWWAMFGFLLGVPFIFSGISHFLKKK